MNRISVVFGLNSLLPTKTLATLTCTYLSCGGFITLPLLTLTSFKARDIALKYAGLSKIGIFALHQERTIFIVSKFEYAKCIGSRPVKLKTISMGISSEKYAIFIPIILWSEIGQPDYLHVCMSKNVQQMHTKCKHR